jgi:V/A-type H+-transporting ATPase subunit D
MIKFQYNKTSLNDMSKQLRMRTRALPTIKSKESALRLEVKKAKDEAQRVAGQLEALMARYDYMVTLWGEFDPELLRVSDVRMRVSKIAGVRIPVLDQVLFEQKPYDLFSSPLWIADGIDVLKELSEKGLQRELLTRRMELLDRARKKTTQKVNLYEKVQIPGYQEAMLKIKRFLEDEENLSKSSQKIVKNRQQQQQQQQEQQNDGTL